MFCDRAVGIARFRPQGSAFFCVYVCCATGLTENCRAVSDLSDPHNDDFSGLQLLSGSYSFPFKVISSFCVFS